MTGILTGKVAFVTGAGSGIGKAVCTLLARDGAKVIATDRNVENVETTVKQLPDSNQHLALEIDVSSRDSIENAFAKVSGKFQRPPTIIVNSAGILRDNFLLKLDDKSFDEVIDVNLKGTFMVTQVAVKLMLDAKVNQGASIVNLASIVGKTGNIGQANYCASKAAVEALTKTASMEFGKFGIRVNAVLPGFIATPMTATIPDKVKQMFFDRIALGRMGKPEEIAEVIAFLASDKSSYVNGASIEVTGGFH